MTLKAPAKVNLHLAVGPLRPDGYHEVLTVMQAVDLFDTVTIEPADDLLVETVPDLGIPPEENLAADAARVLGERFGFEPRFRIRIDKRIPAGGGLGGGSSDAAAAVRGIAALLGISVDSDIQAVAAHLGADVPFFLDGGTALFGERGDRLVRRLETPDIHFVIATPPVSVDTGGVYRAYDERGEPPAPSVDTMLDAVASGDPAAIAAALHNTLAEASVTVASEVGDALAFVQGLEGVLGALVSGSGASVFGVCEGPVAAERAAASAEARGLRAWHARSLGRGVEMAEEM